jgi:hypothetical protein
MPWQEICTVEQREQPVAVILAKDTSGAELCRSRRVFREREYRRTDQQNA